MERSRLSFEQTDAHQGVNQATINDWLVRKRMPDHKLGHLWKFLASEGDAWVETGKSAQLKPKRRPLIPAPGTDTK